MKAVSALFLGIFALFWAGMVLMLDLKFSSGAVLQHRALKYPSTTGEIVHSEVVVHRSRKSGKTYQLKLRYRYAVDDQVFQSERLRYSDLLAGSDARWAYGMLRSHPPGSTVTVFYNPAAPGDAILQRGIGSEELLALMFMAPFNFIALVLCLATGFGIREMFRRRASARVRVIQEPGRIRVRLPSRSPWVALPLTAGLAFIGVLLVVITAGAHPPLALMELTWAAVLGIPGFLFIKRWLRIRSGVEDLVIDRSLGRIVLPCNFGRDQPVVVPLGAIQHVTVESNTRTSGRGTRTTWCPAVKCGDNDESNRLADWTDEARAQLFADWLRQQFGLKPAAPTGG